MDDVLKRLGAVESSVSDIKAEVSGLTATVAHLATKTDVSQVESSLIERIVGMENSLIKWLVGTLIAAVSMAFVVARYLAPN
jgi:hypothetical protein